MGCQLWALSSKSLDACTNAAFRRLVFSLRRALFSRKNGMKAGDQQVTEHLINRRWLLEGFRLILNGVRLCISIVE